ncbi:MAG TPA: DUF6444 domain-containing protein, partial [Methanocorpusculum sp.]|nr:DUF6444 domain-containing protein [Methanocorpusculum sp.]
MSRIQKHTEGYKSDAEIIAILQRQHEEDLAANSELKQTIAELQETIANLNEVIANLTARLNMNSYNSSLPPSHDIVPPSSKNRSLRTKSGKKVGGQPNHKGATRELVD